MNTYSGNLTAQWSSPGQFWSYIDGNGNIIASDNVSGSRQVGVSLDRYKQMENIANEATAKAEEYHKRLVEAGLIVVPPTQEEQIAMLTAQVAKLTQIIEGIAGEASAPTLKPEAQGVPSSNQTSLTYEGTNNGHSGNGESPSPQRQPVAGKNRTGTTTGVSAPAVPVGSGTAHATVRKV